MKTKIGRPRKGKQVSDVVSIRLMPVAKAIIIHRYGTVQTWVDKMYEMEIDPTIKLFTTAAKALSR